MKRQGPPHHGQRWTLPSAAATEGGSEGQDVCHQTSWDGDLASSILFGAAPGGYGALGSQPGPLLAHLVQVLSLGASNSLYKELFFFFNGAWILLILMLSGSSSSGDYPI